jgi:hypothetical protein
LHFVLCSPLVALPSVAKGFAGGAAKWGTLNLTTECGHHKNVAFSH